MAKDGKNFEIPRGPENSSENIRRALMAKIKEQENLSQGASATQSYHQPQQQPQASVNPYPNYTQNPGQGSGYQQNVNYQQYEQARQANQIQYNSPVSNPGYNQNANYGTYASPFAQPNTNEEGLVDAVHSQEPVKYKPKKRTSAGKTILFLIAMIALIFGLSWALREFVFGAYEVPSGSMEKTIMTNDMVFAEKISKHFRAPMRGDIVTFDDPVNNGRILIKRVIATEGQTVDIRNNCLYVDDVEQEEPYVNGLPTTTLSRSKITFPYKVPEGCVWVMGDNRTNSSDSRSFGAIPVDSIIGRALFVYWPFEDFKGLE